MNGLPIQFNDGRLDVVVPEQARDGLSNWTIAHHDGPVAGSAGRHALGGQRGGGGTRRPRTGVEPAPEAWPACSPGFDGIDPSIEEWVEGNGDNGRGHERVDGGICEQAQFFAKRGQDEGELPNLG